MPKRLREPVKQLDSANFNERAAATKALLAMPTTALPNLRGAKKVAGLLEQSRRLDEVIDMGYATAAGTSCLIKMTFTASFTTRHETIANPKMAIIWHQGNGARPGSPTIASTVPKSASAVRATMRLLLGIVAQNQRLSRADNTENTAK